MNFEPVIVHLAPDHGGGQYAILCHPEAPARRIIHVYPWYRIERGWKDVPEGYAWAVTYNKWKVPICVVKRAECVLTFEEALNWAAWYLREGPRP